MIFKANIGYARVAYACFLSLDADSISLPHSRRDDHASRAAVLKLFHFWMSTIPAHIEDPRNTVMRELQ